MVAVSPRHVFRCLGALMMGNLLQSFIEDDTQKLEDREWMWDRYGTAYRSWYTLFEITFDTWLDLA